MKPVQPIKKRWYHYLWIWSVFYFAMGFFNIIFAWLGLISFFLPFVFAIGFGTKDFCNKYCDRGQLLRVLGGQVGFSTGRLMPSWLRSSWFRYGFLTFFMSMFGQMLYTTYLVSAGAKELSEAVTLFWSIRVPWEWAYTAGSVEPWQAQFAFGLYSLMLTSAIIGILLMLLFKPRSWCAVCPMGTMTQMICKVRNNNE
jgi:hypothetical protein